MAQFMLRLTPVKKAGAPMRGKVKGGTAGRAAHHAGVRVTHGASGKSAYLAGEKHVGENGITTDYRNKFGVEHSELVLPGGGTTDREAFWNAVDAHPTRTPTATVARDMIVAFPCEFSFDERKAVARELAVWITDRYGVAVDYGMHLPEVHKGSDSRNFHAHFLISERRVSPAGELGKVQRGLNQLACNRVDRKAGRTERSPTAAAEIRGAWERIANAALERGGHSERIDARTLREQGIDREPQKNRGRIETARMRADVSLRAELSREARALTEKAAAAIRDIAAVQEARKFTEGPPTAHARLGPIEAWQHDALGMLARYWANEDRAMRMRRSMRNQARRKVEMREATPEEARALRIAGRKLARARKLLVGVEELLVKLPDGVVGIEASDRPMTKVRLDEIRKAMRRAPHIDVEKEVSMTV